ncbi:MAG TPA: hypothetical protein VFU50_03800 [Terriglobales bacterium]|nr:hypothetical protein [Terriglobales bacterium]
MISQLSEIAYTQQPFIWSVSSCYSSHVKQVLFGAVLLLLASTTPLWSDNIDAGAHFTIGSNRNPFTNSSIAAGIYLDPALFSVWFPKLPSIRTQTFDVGIGFDRVQQRNGVTADFRWRVPILRCYGWEFRCGGKRFWLMGIPSIGKRWGQGGLGGFAAGQVQAVFDLSKDLACCRLAVGYQHRFPFDSALRHDNAFTLELRTFIGFIDRARSTPRPGT